MIWRGYVGLSSVNPPGDISSPSEFPEAYPLKICVCILSTDTGSVGSPFRVTTHHVSCPFPSGPRRVSGDAQVHLGISPNGHDHAIQMTGYPAHHPLVQLKRERDRGCVVTEASHALLLLSVTGVNLREIIPDDTRQVATRTGPCRTL